MHEKREKNRKESPWTATKGAGQQTSRSGSVGACVAVGSAERWVPEGLWGRGRVSSMGLSFDRAAGPACRTATPAGGRCGARWRRGGMGWSDNIRVGSLDAGKSAVVAWRLR